MNVSSILGVAAPLCLAASFLWTPIVNGNDEDHRSPSQQKADASYVTECGSCHLAYAPDWLPQRSWAKMMSSLDDHFGDNAELAPAEHQHISQYLQTNAADVAVSRLGQKVNRTIAANATPLRLSETAYFKRKHHELSGRMVSGNPKVGSFSRCEACHQNAAKGRFDEDEIKIPGYANWED